ncbi:hypothetical protein ALI22I_04995 [Saccharothrix sp. ALI-22-I]|nr:hypothetical protein ALI22I_04995 [Saccharothrix sp. ALI-22-I]
MNQWSRHAEMPQWALPDVPGYDVDELSEGRAPPPPAAKPPTVRPDLPRHIALLAAVADYLMPARAGPGRRGGHADRGSGREPSRSRPEVVEGAPVDAVLWL